jgi:4-azaleucine resistance transporter AzlC
VEREASFRDGMRAALPLLLPTFALGASFGVLAKPVMGSVAPVVMSVVVYAGGAQFAALSVLQAGGAALPAITAGLLMNARFVPMSFALAPSLRGRTLRRVAESQAIIDASFVLADRRDGTFDRKLLLGATFPQAIAWWSGTVTGVLASTAIPDPNALGIDAVFPAFYLSLLVGEARGRRKAYEAATVAVLITLALVPFAPAGLPVIVASAAALLGLRRA